MRKVGYTVRSGFPVSTDATHIFVWNWGSKIAAFPVLVPDFFVL